MLCIRPSSDFGDEVILVSDQQAEIECPYVIQTKDELNNVKLQPFAMSVDTAVQISVAIMLVWAVGFGFRALARMISKF